MKRLLTISLFISALTTTASAGFTDNKTGWDDLSDIDKGNYIMGVFDNFKFKEARSFIESTLMCLRVCSTASE